MYSLMWVRYALLRNRVILYENLLHKCLSFKVKKRVLINWINNDENCNLRAVVQ